MNSFTLPLQWPAGVTPSALPNFETQARRLRYQALGKACVRTDCPSLLLGHHSDDQAETVLMNLEAFQTGSAIRSMKKHAPIPECWGIHGACQSGSYDKATRRLSRFRAQNLQAKDPAKDAHLTKLASKPSIIESGGIDIFRPLLDFSKERLRQTCEENSIEWEEDESNHDVSVTPRNTIRSLLVNARLPRALQKTSLLHLVSQVARKASDQDWWSTKMFEESEILRLDIRSGTLTVRLHSDILRPNETSKVKPDSEVIHYLRRFARSVSPQEDIALTDLVTAASVLFPSLRDPQTGTPSNDSESFSFTASGVHFTRLPLKTSRETSQEPARGYKFLDPKFVWRLSRQPFPKLQLPTPLIIPPSSPHQRSESVPLMGETSSWNIQSEDQLWSNWQLWDGRYWIRVRNQTSGNLVVRAWEQCEMSAIKNRIPSSVFKNFRSALTAAAPGRIRWTLPVIAEAGRGENQVGGNSASTSDDAQSDLRDSKLDCIGLGKILVFPTLGTAGWLDILDEEGRRKLEWEVRYKHVRLRRRDEKGRSASYSQFVTAWDDGGQGEVANRKND